MGANSKRIITLPSGKSCGLDVYVAAWKKLQAMDPEAMVPGFYWYPEKAGRILREIQRAVHDRINRHIPGRTGKKWDDHYQGQLIQDAQKINGARRFRIYRSNINLPELRARFEHLFASYGD